MNTNSQNAITAPEAATLKAKWESLLRSSLDGKEDAISRFFADEDKGFLHSFKVYRKASEYAERVQQEDGSIVDLEAVEQLSIFHDIGKFFQDLPTWENLKIAQGVYQEFASTQGVLEDTVTKVYQGIPATDFYSQRLEPSGIPPQSIEAEIVRVSDKMQDNLVPKVDRYWFEYGVPRNATFFDPSLTMAQREEFNFENFCGDQMNLILTIICLRKQDISSPTLGQIYEDWVSPMKDQVVSRILSLAEELGESEENVLKIESLITEYRAKFSC
jgi:hypothetical protein